MRKILNDGHSADLRAYFQPPLHALEAGKRCMDRLLADALSRGECGRGGRIQCIVLAGQRHL